MFEYGSNLLRVIFVLIAKLTNELYQHGLDVNSPEVIVVLDVDQQLSAFSLGDLLALALLDH